MPIPTAITDLSATAASNYPAGTDAPSTLDDVQRAHAGFIRNLLDATQTQAYTAYTTAGTSTAYTVTTIPAAAALAENQRYQIEWHTTSGATPTLARDGLTAKNIKVYDLTGAKAAPATGTLVAGVKNDVVYDGTDYVVLNPISETRQIQPVSASVAANALTISASDLALEFRSSTLTSGTVTFVEGAPANLVVPSSATLGTVSATKSRLVVLALNNAGTIELAVVNISGGNDLTETGVISTTAISAAATADSVAYSTTARTSVAYRVIGYIESTQATAGTWATAPSTIQGVGGVALITALNAIGQGANTVNQTASRAFGTTYYNTSGKTRLVNVYSSSATNADLTGIVQGATQWNAFIANAGAAPTLVVAPFNSYRINLNSGSATISSWIEV